MSLYSSSKDVTLTTTETTLHIDEKQQPDRFLTPQPVRQNSAKSGTDYTTKSAQKMRTNCRSFILRFHLQISKAMNRHRHQRLLLCNIPVKRRLGIHAGSDGIQKVHIHDPMCCHCSRIRY